MKHLFTLLALTIGFSMYGQLGPVTENGNTGQRLQTSFASHYGNIGSNAVDLSYSNSSSTTRGATGSYSFAMGIYTTASGNASTAMGNDTEASGNGSIAIGVSTKASGNSSTAIGDNTTASDFGSLVIGQFNLSGATVTNSATQFNTANTAFVIGNGADGSSQSDAFKVLFNGNTTATGSVTATSFIGDGSQLSGTGILSPVTENSNTGVRLSTSNASNHGNIGSNAVDLSYSTGSSTTRGATGNFSIAMGSQATASGLYSTAIGNDTRAFGSGSTAIGVNTEASGNFSIVMGSQATASGNYSTAMGNDTEATGDYSIVMGTSTTASGSISTSMGYSTTASGSRSTAMGNDTEASGSVSTAMGNFTEASGNGSTAMGTSTTASGNNSTVMGDNTTASDYGSLVIGQFNLSGATVTNSATQFNTANTAFVIGNGADGSSQSDAFSVLFSGETVIGSDLEVKGNVLISSDARLKANIVSLGSTLAKLLLIDGKRYTMKKDGKQNIGVLAQDIQKVFPELVSTDDKEMLAVNYQGLVPVLINALKEQDAKMKEQEKRLERLEAIISKIER